MGGFPLVNGFVIAGLLCAALLPLTALTGRETQTVLPPAIHDAASEASIRPGRGIVKFAHRPESIVLRHLDVVLWSQHECDTNEIEFEVGLPSFDPADGIDLLLEVQWPEGSPESVAQLTLEPDSLEGRSATVWGEGSLTEIVTFVWSEDAP